MSYQFEWDPIKAEANLLKHGVSFDEAATVFGDTLALNMPDSRHSLNERRYILLGYSAMRHYVVVAYTERGFRTRLISARRATRQERRQYEEG
ncbi:MAG: BrnT family toxin [Candidatus Hydrogenedentes bacterium]|nr:BrnT family toxin [Candidatus Hydrogenedentota bacterium]